MWFFLLALACSVYAAFNLNRGWVPHDDGALAQGAERVLHGQLPHRDFDEIYGGLLDYLHAAAFALFGTRLLSLRFVLFFFFLCWLPCVYSIGRRFVRPLAAALIMTLAALWSIPLYPGSMPSWYNLFFATFALLSLLKALETDKKSWIFVAGLCCGVSVLIKVTGIYAIAAALLTLLHHEQDVAASPVSARVPWPRLFAWFEIISLVAFVGVILRILDSHTAAPYLFAFLLPCSLLALYLIARTLGVATTLSDSARFRALLAVISPLALGILLPIALYLLPYLARGATGALYHGLFEAPLRRLEITAYSPGDPSRSWAALALLVTILAAMYLREQAWRTFVLFIVAVYLFFHSAHHPLTYRPIWNSLADLLPYATAAILAFMLWGKVGSRSENTKIFAAVAFAVCCNLIRYPFDGAIYTAYVLPLVILAITAASRLTPRRSAGMVAVLILFFSAFAVFRARSSYLAMMSELYIRDEMRTALGVDRGKEILVNAGTAAEYQRAMKLIRIHSHTEYIYAGPDAPDIYFLAGKTNPTRTVFDFLDPEAEQQAMHSLRERPIDVAVIRLRPQFSPPLSSELRRYIDNTFPHAERLGTFEVRWK